MTKRPAPQRRAARRTQTRPGTTDRLVAALGYSFASAGKLTEALTHVSAASPARPDNQRLEFLGDRVLGLVIAEALIDAFPEETEGKLAPRLNALVRKETLSEIAQSIDLGECLQMASAEAMTGGRKKHALLADAMEAVIAAVYRDGGLEAARGVVHRLWRDRITAQDEAPIDAKTALQEWAQAHGQPLPAYDLISRSGPDHAPVFTVEVRLADGRKAEATDAPKRLAEQKAAASLLYRVAVSESS